MLHFGACLAGFPAAAEHQARVAIERGDGSACVWLVRVSGRGYGVAWRALATRMCILHGLHCLHNWSPWSVAVVGPGGAVVVLSWRASQELYNVMV